MSIADDIALLSRNDETAANLQQQFTAIIVMSAAIMEQVTDMQEIVERVRDGISSVTLGSYAYELEVVGRGTEAVFRKCGELTEALSSARQAGAQYIDALHG